ncbi:MAG TPA: hypothetical protein VIS99_05400 [Terrimicrobiaceae bacterium]
MANTILLLERAFVAVAIASRIEAQLDNLSASLGRTKPALVLLGGFWLSGQEAAFLYDKNLRQLDQATPLVLLAKSRISGNRRES